MLQYWQKKPLRVRKAIRTGAAEAHVPVRSIDGRFAGRLSAGIFMTGCRWESGMVEIESPPEPRRTLITSRGEYLEAVERLFAMVRSELRIFDPDLSELDFNGENRIAALRRILSGGRMHRVYIALHDVEHVKTRCPRLIELLLLFPSGLLIYRTEGEAARAQDRFVLADENHVVRRPVASQARGAVLLDDVNEGHGMRLRFDEIWENSIPAVSAVTTGL